jgi:hypothetical protein
MGGELGEEVDGRILGQNRCACYMPLKIEPADQVPADLPLRIRSLDGRQLHSSCL